MISLTELANKFCCDKGTTAFEQHGYTETYATCIPRNGPVRLLEIGIANGASVRMWKEFNSEIEMVAIDILCVTEEIKKLCHEFHQIDQGNRLQLQDLVNGSKGILYDVIIDDGSHEMEDQQVSLSQLLPVVKSGGMYFIEDLHTCVSFPDDVRTDRLLREYAGSQAFRSPFLSGEENDTISKSISCVKFRHADKLAMITRR